MRVPLDHEKKALRQKKVDQKVIDAPEGVRCIRIPNHGHSHFPDGSRLICYDSCGFATHFNHDAFLVSEVI